MLLNSCLSLANRFLHNYDPSKTPPKLKIWKEKQSCIIETPVDKLKVIENWIMLIIEEFEQNAKYFNVTNNKSYNFNFEEEENLKQLLIMKNDNNVLSSEVKRLRQELQYLTEHINHEFKKSIL